MRRFRWSVVGRRRAHSFQFRVSQQLSAARRFSARSVPSPRRPCYIRARLLRRSSPSEQRSRSLGFFSGLALIIACGRAQCLLAFTNRRKWLSWRPIDDMFQCIVQPRNTWSRSSPELRELKVVYPGIDWRCWDFFIIIIISLTSGETG